MNTVTVTINNREVEEKYNQNATISDVVENILMQKSFSDQVVSQIAIDGNILNVEEEDEFLPKRLGEFQTINFTLKSNIELAFEALDSCNAYVDTIVAQIASLTEAYQACRNDEANVLFAEVVEITDLFIQLLSRVQRTLRNQLGDKWEKPASVQQLEIHLLSVLKALVPAKEKNDIIMLCDLLEYELVDNLKQWKIKALPNLRALRPACESITSNS